MALIPTGIAIALPEGHEAEVSAAQRACLKHG
jgi:dUTPase